MTPKILAPCGSIDSLIAAINNNTDAVYFGVDRFNARMKADNFTLENLSKWVDYAHLFNVKVFLTINISLKNNEFYDALQLAKLAQEKNVDGLILTDIGLMRAIREMLPDMYIIASTQLNICNILGAKYISKYCNSIVVSRECSIEQINEIVNAVDSDIECFAHGAMCVSVSGQCLFSSIIGGNSGNRGLCSQPCRQEYTCTVDGRQVNKGYLLSMRDLCTIDQLSNFSKVKMLKIEGRLRRSQYVGQAVSSYKNALTTSKVSAKEIDKLKLIYNRGDFCNGYLNVNQAKKLIDTYIVGHKGLYSGIIIATKSGLLIKAAVDISKGDSFKVIRNGKEIGNGTTITDIDVNKTGEATFVGNICANDLIYITSSIKQISQLDSVTRKLSISLFLKAIENEPLILIAKYDDIEVTEEGNIVESAISSVLTEDTVIRQLSKTSDSPFDVLNINCEIKNAFVNLSSLNSIRRNILQKLSQAIIDNYNIKLSNRRILDKSVFLEASKIEGSTVKNNNAKSAILIINEHTSVQNISNVFETIYIIKPTLYSIDIVAKIISNIPKCAKIFLDLPNFATDNEVNLLTEIITSLNIYGIVANNVYALELASLCNLAIIGGLGLNIFNSYTANYLKHDYKLFKYIFSCELTSNEIWEDENGYLFSQGELILMTLCHCPLALNIENKCSKCNYSDLVYTDKTNAKFLVSRKKLINCYFEIKNCLPISLVHKLNVFENTCINLINNTAVEQTIMCYNELYKGIKQNKIYSDNYFTTGHYNRGVK